MSLYPSYDHKGSAHFFEGNLLKMLNGPGKNQIPGDIHGVWSATRGFFHGLGRNFFSVFLRCDAMVNKGFTLIEILVAVVIFSVLMTTIFSSFKAFVMSSDHIQTAISRDETMGPPLKIISRDLMLAHFSLPPAYVKPDTRSTPDPFRLVGSQENVGGESFSRLRFASRSLLTLHGDGHQRLVQIIYYVRANENGGFDLCRSESLPPWEDGVENGCDPLLIRDISSFELSFFNGENEMFTQWDSDAEGFDHATPDAIGVMIRSKDANAQNDTLAGDAIMTSIVLPVRRDALE